MASPPFPPAPHSLPPHRRSSLSDRECFTPRVAKTRTASAFRNSLLVTRNGCFRHAGWVSRRRKPPENSLLEPCSHGEWGLGMAPDRDCLDRPVEFCKAGSPVGRFPRKRGSRPGRALLQQPCRKHRGWGNCHQTCPIPSIATRYLIHRQLVHSFTKRYKASAGGEIAAFSTSYFPVIPISRRFNILITLLALFRFAALV